MVVGPEVFKWTYLHTTVTVTGTVVAWKDGADALGDGFDLQLDDAFSHLPANTSRGSTIRCETYPDSIAFVTGEGTLINRVVSWPLPRKPLQPFRVTTSSGAAERDLQLGDHVRLRGRLLIENGHPQSTSMRGFLQIGFVFPELHPFDWTDIRLAEPPPAGIGTGQLILAAPLYEMVYSGLWSANRTAGVADHLFLGDTGSLVHSWIAATTKIMAPPPPPGVDPETTAVEYTELVRRKGAGVALGSLRSIQRFVGGIEVTAAVTAPLVQQFDGVRIPDVNDPASDRSVLLVDYEVRWPSPQFGHLWHTIRQPAAWSGLGDVEQQYALFPGPVRAVAATSSAANEAQFLFATDDGHVWHTIRHPGGWTTLGDVNGQLAVPGPVRAVAATSTGPDEAQFVVATEDGHLWHTIRRPAGWVPLGDMSGQLAIPGPVRAVAATSTAAGEAQFLFTTEDGHLWHTVRHPNGTWAGLSDVNARFPIPGLAAAVAATGSAPGEAQFMVSTANGRLWHTIRNPDGSWTGLDPVSAQLPIPGRVAAVAATSSSPGEAQFMFSTEDGHLWHTIRNPDGSWTGLGDVNGQFSIPGPVRAVAATSSTATEAQFLFAT